MAHPGFPRQGPLFGNIFAENCIKLKEIGPKAPPPWICQCDIVLKLFVTKTTCCEYLQTFGAEAKNLFRHGKVMNILF